MKRVSPVLIFTLCTATLGQSASELQSKYSAIEVYKVRPSVWMTPSYAVDGQVCKMILEKRHTTTEDNETVIDEASSFSDAEIQELLDELVPGPDRGERLNGHWLNTTIAGSSISTVDKYENVLVEVEGFLNSTLEESMRSHSKPTPVSEDKHATENEAPSSDHMKLVVLITWRKRQCSDTTQAKKGNGASAH